MGDPSSDARATGVSWPMTSSQFLAGDYLQRCDIVLLRRRGSLFSALAQALSADYFAHSAMIYLTPKRDRGFHRTFVLEDTFAGVKITPLDHFLERHRHYVIAIKRLDHEWFDHQVRKHIRGHMLNFIDDHYDFKRLWTLAVAAFQETVFHFRRAAGGRETAIRSRIRRGKRRPNKFICSGLIQYGFYEASRRLHQDLGAHRIPVNFQNLCDFRQGLQHGHTLESLLSVSPQDLADSERLTWKYAIVAGKATPIADQASFVRWANGGPTPSLGSIEISRSPVP